MRFVSLSLVCIFLACQPDSKEISSRNSSLSDRELTDLYCANCHSYPKPELLPKDTWATHVLPRMGYFYGIYDAQIKRSDLVDPSLESLIAEAGYFPKKATIDTGTWSRIVDFYLSNAPEKLDFPEPCDISKSNPIFKTVKPSLRLSPPSTTLVKIEEGKGVVLGDANTEMLYILDRSGEIQKAAKVKQGAVWFDENPVDIRLTVMGSFSPTDRGSGFVMSLPKGPNKSTRILVDSLRRPVHTSYGDLNGDGREDMVISEFAIWIGNLSWWEQQEDGSYKEHLLRNKPGATKAYIKDLDKDGDPDIIALMAQGDEGIFAYINDGNGNFKEKTLVQLPPSYGSSYFNFCDFNQDGKEDLVYTAGDNADYTPILKPYHGIRIFEQRENLIFEETFFHYLNGAYNAIVEDFDQDGDMDIAGISFFPDWDKKPEESFIFLEQESDGSFNCSTFPEVNEGRWIVMDAGDIDKDGDIDLALGSLTFEVVSKSRGNLINQWIENGIPYILLENTTR